MSFIHELLYKIFNYQLKSLLIIAIYY